ncbi:GNAT family N-acetyltransferase [Streptomyces sp. CA-106110]|uniref:GNAT family N-acetyltransferase n=1 Tax=Streptomyces sp. CA-106110 TaxID=3240044 RepID=UPI003D8E9123
MWQELASVPIPFDAAGEVSVVLSPGSRIGPHGWVGIVLLGGAAIVTAPSEETAGRIRRVFAELPDDKLTDPEEIGKVLPIGEVLGPFALAYVTNDGFRAAAPPAGLRVEEVPGYFDLGDLEQVAGPEDALEAGLDELSSPAFVVRVDGQVVAAAVYYEWPDGVASVSVLTAPAWRRKGLSRATGSAAVKHALAQGMLPQWRTRSAAAKKVALGLGFTELGTHLSVELL